MDMLLQGLIAAGTVLYLLSYFNLRRIFAHAFIVDLACTALLVYAFSGSYAGMMTGVIAGMTLSMFLRVGRKLLGIERMTFVRGYGHIFPTLIWVRSK